MNKYEKAIASLNSELIIDDNADLPPGTKGYYTDECVTDMILINKSVQTQVEKLCVLMEELGHFHTSFGDITDQSDIKNRKQEVRARRWAYRGLISLSEIIKASKEGIRNRYELAEYLDVTEEFLQKAIDYYKSKYGNYYMHDKYLICFEPLGVIEKFF